MDDFEKGMRELAKTSVDNVTRAALERPKVHFTGHNQPQAPRDKIRMMDEVNDTYEKQITQLRGQIGRLSTYIDRLIGPRPEEGATAGNKLQSQGVFYRTMENNADFSAAIRELTSEIERLDNI